MDDKEKDLQNELEELKEASQDFNDMLDDGPRHAKPVEKTEELEEPLTGEEAEEALAKKNIAEAERLLHEERVAKNEENKESSPKETKKDKKAFKRNIIIIVALVAVIGVLCICLSNNKKMDKPKDDTVSTAKVIKKKRDIVIGKNVPSKEEEIKEKIEEKSTTEEYKKWEKMDDKEKEKIDIIPRKEEVPYNVIDEIKEDIKYDEEEKIPEKFNLKDKIKLKVENQGTYGLCWDFASMNALETNLALKHQKDYDFSEIHVDYMTSELLFGYRPIHDGGNFQIFEEYFKNSGAVLEKDLAYKDYKEEEYTKFKDMKPVAVVTETIDYPSRYSIDEEDPDYDKKITEFRNIIKTHIMKNGSLYGTIESSCLNGKNCYTSEESSWIPNHAITVVGWDDTYSKDNFKDQETGSKPKNNGAYIALNSWGEEFGDKGYFYISYEDADIETMLSGVVNTSLDRDSYVKLSSIKNKYILSEVEKQAGDEITTINGIKYISKLSLKNVSIPEDLSNKNITNDDLETLNYFRIYSIDLSNNNITDISKLKNNNIMVLDLSNNNITKIDKLEMPKLYSIDISNNPIKDVSGLKDISSLETLELNNTPNLDSTTLPTQIYDLTIKNSNITKLPEFKNISYLDLSENKNIDLSILPKTINSLSLEKCEIDDLSKLSVEEVRHLYLANNNISDISKLKDYKFYSLDLSSNKITDFSQIKDLKVPTESDDEESDLEEDEDYYGEDELATAEILLDNMGIKDISIINDIQFSMVSLKNNEITDLSNYKTDLISLDLSGNKGIEDISPLYNVDILELKNCDIKALKYDPKEESEIDTLDLSDNNITNVSFVEKLTNIYYLSLSGNKDIKGPIKSEDLSHLNIENCNIKTLKGLLELPNLHQLYISNNKEIDLKDSIKSLPNVDEESYLYIYLEDEEIAYEEVEELEKLLAEKNICIILFNLVINTTEKELDLSNYPLLKDAIDNSVYYEINGGTYKDGIITIDDIDKGVTLKTVEDITEHLFESKTIIRNYK